MCACGNDCARPTARCVVAAVAACAGVARVRVYVCVCVASLIGRAREASRDRATHSNDCARPTAMCVVAVVAVPYMVVARVCVCVCVCVCGCFLDRAREATRDRATHGIVCALSTARRVPREIVGTWRAGSAEVLFADATQS